jgi:dTDP-4-amino-4,6-dideoxy-D-glucose acyltransferase
MIFSKEYNKDLLKSYGKNVFVSSSTEIRRPQFVTLGNHVDIDSFCYITTQLIAADYVHIAPYVGIIGGAQGLLQMGNFTNIAIGSKIICVSDTFIGDGLIGSQDIPLHLRSLKAAPIIFKNFANVGANSIILPGVTLEEGTVIGANSLVTKSTEPWTVYGGSPARPIKQRPKDTMLKYAQELGY